MDVDEILTRAILKEIAAYELYHETARATDTESVANLLEELKEEEREHREELEALDPDDVGSFHPDVEVDLQLAKYLKETQLGPHTGLEETLIYAIHREQDAYAFYSLMAAQVPEMDARRLFQKLATMENTHKARLEQIYETLFMRNR